jgi:hypothetical protein
MNPTDKNPQKKSVGFIYPLGKKIDSKNLTPTDRGIQLIKSF